MTTTLVEKDRKVKIVTTDGKTYEGKVLKSTQHGYLLRTKGGGAGELIETSDIDTVEAIEGGDEGLKQVVLKPVTPSKVKRHLVDRHGWILSAVNGLNEADAVKAHEEIHVSENHEDLGHRHEDAKPEATASESSSDSE